ncbi:PilW family protein [Piscinibacter sp.]|uniref:PilW family protein n=1 Tax=Piscinibacter sp. TaxID=1903157 RepID=UPI0039E42ED9
MAAVSSPIAMPCRNRGFSLIELMVGVAIGLVLTLAIFQVLILSEGRKRSLTGVNDVSQSGAYSVYVIDRILRSAGSGYAQGLSRVGGCRISARLPAATGETLPRVNAFPAPFSAVPREQRLAPVVIFPGASDTGSDVIMVMSGASGYGEVLADVQPSSIGAADLRLANTIGYRAGDLVMIAGGDECLLSQVSAAKPVCAGEPTSPTPTTACGPLLPLAGDYFTAAGTHTSLAALNGVVGATTFTLGNPGAGNLPEFTLLGVGENSTLFRHDLLLTNGQNTSEPVAEGVRVLRAVYGIDTNNDGVLDAWQSPSAAGWDGASLMNGSALSNQRLRQIVAVRVGLVLRSALVEKEIQAGVPVAPETLTLFGDLPVPASDKEVDLTATGENRNQRHRTVEVTVPLRNILMLP